MKKTLWGFSDSWGAGWGLKQHETTYTELFAKNLKLNCCNESQSGFGLGQILYKFVMHSNNFQENDIVLITVPPDTRWYSTNEPGREHDNFKTMFSTDPDYEKFLELIKGNVFWFEWHHGLFLSMLCFIARETKVKILLQHNYGMISSVPNLEYHKQYFLDFEHSMTHWLTGNDYYDYSDAYCGLTTESVKYNNYFINRDNHPNQLGHKKIADRLLTLYKERQHTS